MNVELRVVPAHSKHPVNVITISIIDLVLTGKKGHSTERKDLSAAAAVSLMGLMERGKEQKREAGGEPLQRTVTWVRGEKSCILHPPEQFLRVATVPRNVLRPRQALSISGRLRMGWEGREGKAT